MVHNQQETMSKATFSTQFRVEGETKEVLTNMVKYLIECNVFSHEAWCEYVAGECNEEDDACDEKYSLEVFKRDMIETAGASVDAFSDFVKTNPKGVIVPTSREWRYKIVPSKTEGHIVGFVRFVARSTI